MKAAIGIVLTALIFIGCSKNGEVTPATGNTSGATTSTGTTTGTSTGTSTIPPAIILTHDDSIHLATFNVKPNLLKATVTDNKLVIIFNENVDLLFNAEGYKKISAIHLSEDFKSTLLKDFQFTTVAEQGNVTLNWVDDNLNNVIKTVKDTVVNNVNMVKVSVHRPFTFFKSYDSNATAITQRDIIINKTDDTVGFTAYSYYNLKNYPKTSAKTTLTYTKQ